VTVRTLASSPAVGRVRDELSRRGRRRAAGGRFVHRDPRFAGVTGRAPRLVRLAATDAHEGPVYAAAEDALYYTSVPRPGERGPVVDVRRLQLATGAITVVRPDANVANGMCLDRGGALLVCEQGTFERPARIARLDPRTGDAETVVDACDGRPLSSPNDVVVRSDGTIWFTDPTYGHLQGFRPPPEAGDHVVRHDPATGETAVAARGFDKPNGLAFSPDERVLYVADNGAPHRLLAFDVRGARAVRGRVVAASTPEHPDGLKVDAAGRIYGTSSTGVRVWTPAGELLGEIRLPGAVNLAFGGPRRDVLFITTDTAVWAAFLEAKGA
jgi:gluconolactonase